MFKNNKTIKVFSFASLALIALNGCSTPIVGELECSDKLTSMGYFCYEGHNFGLNRTLDFKTGVADGCVTAKGKFQKNYSMSKVSKEYNDGWILARGKCRLAEYPEEEQNPKETQHKNDRNIQSN